MQPTIQKSSETEVIITSSKIVDISEIKQNFDDAQTLFDQATKDLADFEAWVLLERTARQTIVDEAQKAIAASSSLVDEAASVGVVEAAVSVTPELG